MASDRPRRLPAYGLDIETDTTIDGLDPTCSRVTALGVAGDGWQKTFTGREPSLLAEADGFLHRLDPGVLVTWNGGGFDLPFLADRAAATGVALGLWLRPDGGGPLAHRHLGGHDARYRGRWWHHAHVDAYEELRPVAHRFGLAAGLKPFARLHGIDCLEEDRTALHRLPADRLAAYVGSDAAATRSLARLYDVA